MPSDQYTIIVSGQRFVFTRDQLESEPDNYFAEFFSSDWEDDSENTRELNMETEPLLFKLIQAHLRGYTILPIQEAYIPDYMSRSSAMKSLRKEADDYGLNRLVALIDAEDKRKTVDAPKLTPWARREERIYQISIHVPNHDGLVPKISTPLSLEGLEFMMRETRFLHADAKCRVCWLLSRGWELVTWLEIPPKTSGGHATHCVIEAKRA